jgi:hypothetical protein
MFRRELALATLAIASVVMVGIGSLWLLTPSHVISTLPLATVSLVLSIMWVHGVARRRARRRELERSFAQLTVLYQGNRYEIGSSPLIGEFPTRRHAARAALDRGGWAVIVRAWDRYYVLACVPAEATDAYAVTPVSFRSRAVADVVPAIRDDVALGA